MSATTTAKKGASETGDPLLLTPGPLTTSKSVKSVMVHDWGSRDATFLRINREVLERLPEIVHGAATHVTVPMQGSGTFAVEAMLTTFVPPAGKVLLLINGAYGQRARKILEIAAAPSSCTRRRRTRRPISPGRRARCSRRTPPSPMSSRCIARRPAASSIRSTRSRLSPHSTAGASCWTAMSAFGALPIDARTMQVDAHRRLVQQVHRGRARPRLRDLPQGGAGRDQGQCDDAGARSARPVAELRQDRPVPLHAADPRHRVVPPGAEEFFAEGGAARTRRPLRRQRPGADRRHARTGLQAAAAATACRRRSSSPSTCRTIRNSSSRRFYDALKDRGYVIYPGKLTVAD